MAPSKILAPKRFVNGKMIEVDDQNAIIEDNSDSFDAADFKPIKRVVNLDEIGAFEWKSLTDVANSLRSLEYDPEGKTLKVKTR